MKNGIDHAPPLVRKLCMNHGCWIVGGAAEPGVTEPKDWDVLVPWSRWQEVCTLIPPNARPNTYGGWKIDEKIDVWPQELSYYFTTEQATWAWQPRLNIRLQRIRCNG